MLAPRLAGGSSHAPAANVGQRVAGLQSPAFYVDQSASNLISSWTTSIYMTTSQSMYTIRLHGYTYTNTRSTEDASSSRVAVKGAKTTGSWGKWDPSPKSFLPSVHPLSFLGPINIATRKPDFPRSHLLHYSHPAHTLAAGSPSTKSGFWGGGQKLPSYVMNQPTHFLMAPTPGLSRRNAQMPVHEQRPDSRVRLTMPG